MNGSLYFETQPWQAALARMQQDGLGAVIQVGVQATCPRGGCDEAARQWDKRLAGLLGEKQRADTLRREGALSELAVYPGGAVARVFIGEAEDGFAEGFEIVTEKALLVWKPAMQPQGYSPSAFIDCTQPYSIELEV